MFTVLPQVHLPVDPSLRLCPCLKYKYVLVCRLILPWHWLSSNASIVFIMYSNLNLRTPSCTVYYTPFIPSTWWGLSWCLSELFMDRAEFCFWPSLSELIIWVMIHYRLWILIPPPPYHSGLLKPRSHICCSQLDPENLACRTRIGCESLSDSWFRLPRAYLLC